MMKKIWLLCALGVFVLMLTTACGSSEKNQKEAFKEWFTVVEAELDSIDKNLLETEQIIQSKPRDRSEIEEKFKRIKQLQKEIDKHQEKIRDQKVPKLDNKDDYDKLKECADKLGSINYHAAMDSILDFNEKLKKGEDGKNTLQDGLKQLHNLNQWSNELYLDVLAIAAKIDKELVSVSSDNKKTETNNDIKNQVDKKDESKDISNDTSNKQLAQDFFNEVGFSRNVVATSFGHSDKGFLTRFENDDVIFVDIANNRLIGVVPMRSISQIAGYKGNAKQSIQLLLVLTNDTRDGDAANGSWDGNNHTLPVQVEYNYENGKHVPYMIKSGSGTSPASFDNYLYEQKNVDAVNTIVEEAAFLK